MTGRVYGSISQMSTCSTAVGNLRVVISQILQTDKSALCSGVYDINLPLSRYLVKCGFDVRPQLPELVVLKQEKQTKRL